MSSLFATLRISAATLLVCVAGYTAVILAFAQVVTPATADGHLVTDARGRVVGSRQIAQDFTSARYFWPRPSAASYDASAAAGSNKSPTSPDLTERASETIVRFGATPDRPLPADLAAASGAGLDPHISLAGALYQSARVAEARGLPVAEVRSLVEAQAFRPGAFLTAGRIVNVLELNLALDAAGA